MSQPINMDVVEELLALCEDGDPELLVDLIRMFLQDGPTKVGTIETATSGREFARVERAAHSLKGSAGNLGAVAVQEDCEQLQEAVRRGQLQHLPALVGQLRAHFAEAEMALQDLLSRYT